MRKNQNAEIRRPEILENYYQVIVEEGLEGASIGKVAKRMNIHPSLIIHYFKSKNNMTIELVDLLVEKYEAADFLRFDGIDDPEKKFDKLMDTIFSYEWSRSVDPGVHFGFYYLSFRNADIRKRFKKMFARFRDYLVDELNQFKEKGIIHVKDVKKAADIIVILIEGLEFHAHFLSGGGSFKEFSDASREIALNILRNDKGSGNY